MSTPQTLNTRARTKIVATVGPACREESQLEELYRAGVDVFRLNAAHASVEEHQVTLDSIRRISERLGAPIGVLIDLAGPKIRLGELCDAAVECRLGETLRFVRGTTSPCRDHLVSSYPRLIDELEVGKTVMLADGTVALLVEYVSREEVVVRVTQEGLIRSRQGINLPGVRVGLPSMSKDDLHYATWAAEAGCDFIGLSFVRSAEDVQGLRALLEAHDSPARIIAKIEKPEALEHLEAIVAAADGIMVARGDLGVEIDIARVPVVQKEIVALCNRSQKPVIIATQMLDSMQQSRRPTRAEATDVANAILDGCDACMLSGETAIGHFPRAAVEMMNRIALATEELYQRRQPPGAPGVLPAGLRRVTQAVIVGAAHIAQRLDARLIVVASHTGATALASSKQRSFIPTIGVSDSPAVLRRMCLYWGVIPLVGAPVDDPAGLLAHLTSWGLREGCLAGGDWIVLVAGSGISPQGHNAITAHQVQAT